MLYNVTEQLKNEKQRADDAHLGTPTKRGSLLNRMLRRQILMRYIKFPCCVVCADADGIFGCVIIGAAIVQGSTRQRAYRTQEVLSTVEQQRHEAEEEAARALK
jgi:hypothetical protein